MDHSVLRAWSLVILGLLVCALIGGLFASIAFARNITSYKDLISNSTPNSASNHTLTFTLGTDIGPGAYFEITPPSGFETLGTTTFEADRNVELRVNNVLRDADTTQSATDDEVVITPGTPGMIRYTLNTTTGISTGSQLEFKIGNHTSKSRGFSEEYSTTTLATTTIYADVKPIVNASTVGTHKVAVRVFDGAQVADADFSIALIDQVGIGPIDTTEEIPPRRFNGSPTSTVTGVTLNVEIFLETNELAICRYSLTPDVAYAAMSNTFSNTGMIFHSQVVPVTPNSTQSFYVRCIDDEGNFNIDDYLIQFQVSDIPTGDANEDGDVEGDGTGSGNDGSGTGDGGGGTEGSSDGDTPTTGDSAGNGGNGGGGGGGSGPDSGDTAGGGFESQDAPYQSGDGRVTITGLAYPRSRVVALVDGKEATTVQTNGSGEYSIVLDEIARGVYTFGVYALDPTGVRSSTFSTSFTVTGARTSALSNIHLGSTIKVTPDPVTPGQTLTLSGYTQPNAVVTLENEKDGSSASRQTLTATADNNGAWRTTVDTSGFSVGTYKVRAKSAQSGGVSTNFSNFVLYGVGQSAVRPINADLNRDGKVNLVDFSILLFWWGSDGGTSDPSADINGDNKVNLVDFSILLFNWTG